MSPWDEAWSRAVAEWPDTGVTREAFERVAAQSEVDPGALHAADLLWALACLRGHELALAALAKRLAQALASLALTPTERDELARHTLVSLAVSQGATAPKLSKYFGRAPLGAWLHVVATRGASDLRRATQRELELDESVLLGEAAPGEAPELALMKERFGPVVAEALRAGVKSLTPRQRNLLRQHYLDGVSLDALGGTYRAHRATVSRWLQDARAQVLTSVRDEVRRASGLSSKELLDMVELVRSRLEFTASLFATHAEPSRAEDFTQTEG